MKIINPGLQRRVAVGDYTGDNGDARQIVTGFPCALVIIQVSNNVQRAVLIPGITIKDRDEAAGDNSDITAQVYIHATDGFVVENTVSAMNFLAWTFYYVAIEAD